MANDEAPPGTLVARALAVPPGKFRGRPVNDELTDLAIAFVRGDVTSTQAAAVLGGARQGAVQRLWTTFRRAVASGRVTIADTWQAPIAEGYEQDTQAPERYSLPAQPPYRNGGHR